MSDGQQLLDVGCRGEESRSAVVTGCNYTKLALKKHTIFRKVREHVSFFRNV